MAELRILVIGAGAIGSYIGGSLQLSGQRAVFVDRPGSAEALKRNGFTITIGGMSRTISQLEVFSDVAAALTSGPFDATLVAVKSYDTLALAEQFAPLKAQLPPVICMQNGVENEAVLGAAIGGEKVIPGTLTTAIGKPEPGQIVVEKLRGIGIASNSPVGIAIRDGFNLAGLHARLYDSAPSMKWSKMLTNLLGNASSAILDMSPAEIFAHPGLFEMEVRQFREALAVMKVLSLRVVNLPGTPVRMLAFLLDQLPPTISRGLAVRFLGHGRGGKMPSFHIDLYGGSHKSEVDYLNGAVGRFGRQTGVATPVNDMLTNTLLQLVSRDIPLDYYRHQPEKLLAIL